MGALVVGEEIGKEGGDGGVEVAVAAAVAGVAAGVAAGAAAAVVAVGFVAVVGGGRRDYTEAGWVGGTIEGIVGAADVEVDGPTFEIEKGNRMGTVVDRGRDRKTRWKGGVVADQGAWMVACRCGQEIGSEVCDAVVAVNKLAVGSSFGRLDVEA